MSLPHFFAGAPQPGELVALSPEDARHAIRSLRLGVGDRFTSADGEGGVAEVRIVRADRLLVEGEVVDRREEVREGPLLSVLLAPYDDMGAFSGRVRVSVPRMGVGEQAATTLALVIHELATNSVKYGALSSETGTLDVSCAPHESEVAVVWTERGGPPVVPPTGLNGYGSKLVDRAALQLGGSVKREWAPEGAIITLQMDKARLAG